MESLSKNENSIISTGGGVVLRKENMTWLKKNGLVFYLDRPIRDIISTVNPETRPLLKNGKEVLYKLKKNVSLYTFVIAIIILMLLQWKRQYRKLYQYIINTRKEFHKAFPQ